MNINLTPEQEQLINDQLKSSHFDTPEEVIAKALVTLRERSISAPASNGCQEKAVKEMLAFFEKKRTPLKDSGKTKGKPTHQLRRSISI